MNWFRQVVLFIGILLTCSGLPAQTLHVIGFYPTNDSKLGKAFALDQNRLENGFVSEVSRTLSGFGINTRSQSFVDTLCTKASLVTALDSLKVGSDDIVLFFYSGHGTRAMNDPDVFPQMCLAEYTQRNYVPVSTVRKILVSKGGRLNLIFSDCCNKEASWVDPKPYKESPYSATNASYLAEACRRLFVETGGTVAMTSSRAGEYSWGNNSYGSEFFTFFMREWEKVKNGTLKADWNSFCSSVQYNLSITPINSKDYGTVYQHPYFEIDQKTTSEKQESVKSAENAEDPFKALNQAVNQLLDKSLSQSSKLQMIDGIQQRHFRPGARVVTMLEDRNTIIRYETVTDFLERLARSEGISRVKFFQFESNKYSVYEYR